MPTHGEILTTRWLTGAMEQVAMFPLGTVLLPAMPLTLRIFEERYQAMLRDLLDRAEPEFGVVLIERGHEAGGGDTRFGVGTMARLARVVTGEGTDDIGLLAYGGRRIRVSQWLDDAPYPRAMVEELPTLEWKDELTPLRDEAEHAVRRALARSAEYADPRWDADVPLSDDRVTAAWQLAGIAPLGPIDQLKLLTSRTTGELLQQTLDLTLAAEPTLTAPDIDADFDAALAELLDAGDDDEDADGRA